MDQLLFILLVSSLSGFLAGFLGMLCHQKHQRNADKKRWDEFIHPQDYKMLKQDEDNVIKKSN